MSAFLASPEQIGPLLRWVDSVEQLAPDTTRWTLRAPAGKRVQCTLIQSQTQEPAVLHWKTPGDARWAHDISLSLSPAPAGRGTQVKAVVVCKPAMKPGDIIGHEFMGEVVEVGKGITDLRQGDKVVTISIIGCGNCEPCQRSDFSCCDNSNPNPSATDLMYGQPCCGILGYSHAFGGYPGSHATYVRVPFADVNLFKVPEGVSDEQALFVSDAAPTGYFAADNAGIQPGDTVAVWGCGGVGQMAICSAYLLGAERVIAIDRYPDRLRLAQERGKAIPINYEKTNVHEALLELTGGRGPDRCIDCVGMEAHGTEIDYAYDKAKQLLRLHTERGSVLRQAIRACRKGGTVSVVGVYGGLLDKFPMGAIVNKALTLKSGQQPGQRYAATLFEHIQKGELDPAYLLTHPMSLEDGAQGYAMFKEKTDQCLRAVFRP